MITRLGEVPELTRSWLGGIDDEDSELYKEFADSIIIMKPKTIVIGPRSKNLPHDVIETLERLDLNGKEIGAFCFAPVKAPDAVTALLAYQNVGHSYFKAPEGTVFIGDYGQDWVVFTNGQYALVSGAGKCVDFYFLSTTFQDFVIAQANAYDSFKRLIVESCDEAAYYAEAKAYANILPRSRVDIERIFYSQIKS